MTTSEVRRPDVSPEPWVVSGDVVVLLAFVAFGLVTHDVDPIANPGHWLATATPFVVGWLVASAALDAQGVRARRSYRYAALSSTAAWVAGALLGAVLRYGPRYLSGGGVDSSIALQFTFVMVAFGLSFILPWRLCVVYLNREALST